MSDRLSSSSLAANLAVALGKFLSQSLNFFEAVVQAGGLPGDGCVLAQSCASSLGQLRAPIHCDISPRCEVCYVIRAARVISSSSKLLLIQETPLEIAPHNRH